VSPFAICLSRSIADVADEIDEVVLKSLVSAWVVWCDNLNHLYLDTWIVFVWAANYFVAAGNIVLSLVVYWLP